MPPFFASLPESHWAEINRRLLGEPALRELTTNKAIIAACVEKCGGLTQWRPGPLGLVALAALEPQAASDPIRWLKTAGRDYLADAYNGLITNYQLPITNIDSTANSREYPQLVRATLAAVALRQRLAATHDLDSLVAEAAASPDTARTPPLAGHTRSGAGRFALPLICLYGLLDSPHDLVAALLSEAVRRLESAAELAEMIVRILAANETAQTLIDSIGNYLTDTPPALRLSLACAFTARGLPAVARAAAREAANNQLPITNSPILQSPPSNLQPPASALPSLLHALADGLEHIFLSEAAGDESARSMLGRAVEAAQTFTAELALRFGQRSLAEGDPVSAIAAFQEAQTLRPYDRQTHALLAEAAAERGDERAALIALGHAGKGKTEPAAKLAAARAYHKLGDTAQARECALAALNCEDCQHDPAALVQAAELLSAAGDHDAALNAWGKVIADRPAVAGAYLAHARHALILHRRELALESAWQAAGLEPENSLARQTLAEALGLAGDANGALAHWTRVTELDPRPEVQLKRAEAALAAREPKLALQIAESILQNSENESLANTGLPHIIAGRALTALDDTARAFEYFNQAVALAPTSVESWRAVSAYHKARGDAHRALAALDAGRRLIDVNAPDAADFFADLGELRAELHHLSEAAAAYEKAAHLKPTHITFLRRLGELYGLQNKLPAAIEVIQRATSVAASDPALWHLLGQMLESAGRFGEALAAYRHAQATGGAFTQLFRDLGRLAYQQSDLPVARAALESILVGRDKFDPADLDPLILLGAIYESAKEFGAALAVYRHAIALEPLRSDLCVRLGACCLELGQPEAAIAALKDAAERDLDSLSLQKMIGQAYSAAHLWTEAELAFQQAARLAPDDHGLLQTFAHAARKAGEPGRAITALQKAIALAPDCGDYRRDLADLFISQSKLAEAKSLYAEATRLTSNSSDLWMGLGQVQLMLNEIAEAAVSFERAATLNPDRADVMQAVGETQWLLRSYEAAHAAFARAAELAPANPVPLRRAGECMWELGRHVLAMALWQKGLVSHPNDAATHARLGEAFNTQGRYAEAFAEYERAAAAAPADPILLAAAGRAAIKTGDSSRAIIHLERATQIKADDAEVWQLLGEAHHAKGQIEPALTAIRKATRLAPHSGLAHAALAQLLTESGNLAEALTSIEAALAAGPDDPGVLSAAGRVFVRAGRHAEAVQVEKKVAAARPDDPSAHLALARALVLEAEAQSPVSNSPITNSQIANHWAFSQPQFDDLLLRSLERAGALGADANEVQEWLGRARALLGELAEALPLLEAAAAVRPSADLLRALAACYRRVGKLPLARQVILASLEHGPEIIASVIEFGLVCLAQDDKAAARAAFQRAISLDVHCAHAYQLLADTMIALGERAEALVIYNQAISLDPTQAAWHNRLAELYEAGRDPASALAHYQRAASLAVQQSLPAAETANYLAALARAYARDHDLESACQQFEAALALRGDVAMWWAQCAQLNHELKNFERAFECFNRASDLQPRPGRGQPNDTAAYMGAARAALALGREEEAEEKILSVLRNDPDNHDALIAMAEVFERRKDFENALIAYAQAARVAPNPLPAILAQARLYRELNRNIEAIECLTQAAKLAPDDDQAIALLGEALAAAGRIPEAIQYLQRAIQISPRTAAHYVRLGRLCRLAGQLDAALGHLQHVREHADALREMALVFVDRRQYNRAYEIYQELIALEPDNADNFFRAGLALKEMRDYLDALTFFQQAVKLDPDNVEAQHQRATVAAIGILRGKN